MRVGVGTACGRVNLMGEHTDYNGGFVLPTAVSQGTRVEVSLRQDRQVFVQSTSFLAPRSHFHYRLGEEVPQREWIDYVQGMTWVLRTHGFSLQGFDAQIESTIPMGSGLSSSAALEVSLLKALRSAFELPLDDIGIARLAQQGENDFVGARVGILDPMAVSFCRPGQALLMDTQSLETRSIKLELNQVDLAVIHSGVVHSNAHGGGYQQRRRECEQACLLLGVSQLRELTREELEQKKQRLPETLYRRVRHVLTENERVFQAVEALQQSDFQRLGAIFYASHQSMKDDYEVSIPEVDALIQLCQSLPQVYGARLTGGGFGGSIVVLTAPGQSQSVTQTLSPGSA